MRMKIAKTVTGLCVLCDIHAVGEEIVCVTENGHNLCEAEERIMHLAYSTT